MVSYERNEELDVFIRTDLQKIADRLKYPFVIPVLLEPSEKCEYLVADGAGDRVTMYDDG